MTSFLLGVAWPYANNELHIGHFAGSLLPPDIFARFQRMRGHKVLMVGGSDCHGTPITVSAEKFQTTPELIVEKYHQSFLETLGLMGISFDCYTMTSTKNHRDTVHEMFLAHKKNGYLYKETQKQLFDPLVNKFLPDRYVEGECPFCQYLEARGDQCDRCGKTYDAVQLKNPKSKLSSAETLEIKDTEHYVFALGKFNDFLFDWLNSPDKKNWRNHVINFARGMMEKKELRGRAISRDMNWGVSIPADDSSGKVEAGFENKRLYVWYEAVMGYLSAAREWAKNHSTPEAWKDYWLNPDCKSIYFMGKDNITFHAVLWPAFIKAYGGNLILPFDVPANEYLNSGGNKLSKSRGNMIPMKVAVKHFQLDAWRYVLTALAPENSDSDFTWEEFYGRVNSELVANWGNLVNRVLGFAQKRFAGIVPQYSDLDDVDLELLGKIKTAFAAVEKKFDAVQLRSGLEETRSATQLVNQYLSERAPWTLVKTDEKKAATVMFVAIQAIEWLNTMWAPVLIDSAAKVNHMLGWTGDYFGKVVKKSSADALDPHDYLTYEESSTAARWELRSISPGQKLGEILPLFQKLESKDVLPEPVFEVGI